MSARQRRQQRRAFDRVREQLRLATAGLVVAGELIRELRATHRADLGRMAELVCNLLEADAENTELRASLGRMTGRYAEALRELQAERERHRADDSDECWSELARQGQEAATHG